MGAAGGSGRIGYAMAGRPGRGRSSQGATFHPPGQPFGRAIEKIMSWGLLCRKDRDPKDYPPCSGMTVRGVKYSNSAAKFWPGLVEEVTEEFPQCTRIELSAPIGVALSRRHLFPQIDLQKDMDDLMKLDFDEAMSQAIAEMNLIGPPSPVRVRLAAGEGYLFESDLPPDCLDSETFLCLVAWLLEWARIPPSRWNDDALRGAFAARDIAKPVTYGFSFRLSYQPLSEGLRRLDVAIVFSVARGQ